MEAPKGRYSVVEKDGRLIVIDNRTGSAAASTTPSPRPGRPGGSPAPVRPGQLPTPPRSSASRPPSRPPVSPPPISSGPEMFDGIGGFLVAIASKDYDADGNAIVGWEWKSNNRTRRWDARLDPAQQRRFGRALLALCVSPLPIITLLVLDQNALFAGMVLSVPLFAWGFQSIVRLQKETGGLSG